MVLMPSNVLRVWHQLLVRSNAIHISIVPKRCSQNLNLCTSDNPVLLLTSLSSTAFQPRSSRHNRLPGIQSGQEHGGTSGGSTRTCF